MTDVSTMRLGLIHRPHPCLPRISAHLAGQVPPVVADWHGRIALDGDALGNDQVGNCVECGTLRAIQIMRAVAAGDGRKPTASEALALYRAWAGWDGTPGGASDCGTASDVAAAQWASTGVAWGEQWRDVPAVAGFDPRIASHLRAAIAWLGPVQLDLDMPLSAQDQETWSVGDGEAGRPGSWGAHRVCVGKYDACGFTCVTWGVERPMTEAFVETYALDAMVCVSRSWLDVLGRSPLGLDLDALEAASRNLGG